MPAREREKFWMGMGLKQVGAWVRAHFSGADEETYPHWIVNPFEILKEKMPFSDCLKVTTPSGVWQLVASVSGVPWSVTDQFSFNQNLVNQTTLISEHGWGVFALDQNHHLEQLAMNLSPQDVDCFGQELMERSAASSDRIKIEIIGGGLRVPAE